MVSRRFRALRLGPDRVRLVGGADGGYLLRYPTFPLDAPTVQLDHILVAGEIGPVVASQAVRLPLSDHRALVVDIQS